MNQPCSMKDTDSIPASSHMDPRSPLVPSRTPDIVLIIGATGQIGRAFLEQGREMYGDDVEFRVLLRNMGDASRFYDGVRCFEGDVRDVASLRRASVGMGVKSLLFDSCTHIDLAYEDTDGSITGINLDGAVNVIALAREQGIPLHKAHSIAGLATPKEGPIDEDTEAAPGTEEEIYATLPYLRSKRTVTRHLLEALEQGQAVMFSYLVTPWGPYCRPDALSKAVIDWSLKGKHYFYPKDMGIAYVDARDVTRFHWHAYMDEVHDHFVLASPLRQKQFVAFLSKACGFRLRATGLSFPFMARVGKAMDLLKRSVFHNATFPISEAIVHLMFANNAYSTEKARRMRGFEPRPAEETFSDHFQDLIQRGLLESKVQRRKERHAPYR
jgi:dihydroflavonol-4-reductase